MGLIQAIDKSKITPYQANRINLYDFKEVNGGSKFYFGRNWNGSNTTQHYVTKIKIDTSSLAASDDVAIRFTMKSAASYAGPGYINAKVTTTDFSSDDNMFASNTWYTPTSTFSSSIIASCSNTSGYSLSNSANGATISFEATHVKLDPNKPYYVYFYDVGRSDSNVGICTVYNNDASLKVEIEYPYTNVGEPTNASISSASVYRDSNITINWGAAANGISNNVKNYRIHYGIGTTQTYSKTFDTNDAISTNKTLSVLNDLGGPIKGSTLHFGIQAIGSVSGYDSPVVYIGSCQVINKAPDAPIFSIVGVLRADGTDTSITINNLFSSDVDNDQLTYYYIISNSSTVPSTNSSSLITNGTSLNMNKDKVYLYIQSYDGEKYSSFTKGIVSVNTPPIINNISITGENIQTKGGTPCSGLVSATASISKEITKYEWQIKTEDGEWQKFSDISSPKNIDIKSNSKLVPGKKILLKLTVWDYVGDSAVLEKESNFTKITNLSSPNLINLINNESTFDNSIISASYINEKIKINYTVPTLSNLDVPYKSLGLYSKNGDIDILIGSLDLNKSQQEITYNFNFDINYQFFIRLTDTTNRYTDSNLTTIYKRLPKINLAFYTNRLSHLEWKPLSDTSLSITTGFLDSNSIGKNKYELYGNINNEGEKLLDTFYYDNTDSTSLFQRTVNVSGSTITVTYNKPWELFKKFEKPSNQARYSVKYTIKAYNAFGVASDSSGYGIISNGTIVTQENPTLEGDFKIRIGYTTDSNLTSITYQNLPDSSSSNLTKIFNSGEVLDFCISQKATDKNDTYFDGSNEFKISTIKSYCIQYSIQQNIWNTLTTLSSSDFNTTVNFNNIIYYHKSIIAPQIEEWIGKNISFRIFAIDDTNLESNSIVYGTTLIAGRKAKPVISLTEVNYADLKLTINFNVVDYGGNDKGIINFTRKGTEKVAFKLYYGTESSNLTLVKTDSILLDKFTNHIFNSINLSDNTLIYLKVEIIIDTNSLGGAHNQISTISDIYALYLAGPTVSYRNHWIGVNTNANKDEDVFHVSSFGDRKIIRLTGFSDNQEKTITIDLNTGELIGVTISGGTW